MDRDAEKADRQDQALQGDTGMIGSESEEPGPGRDTYLADPDHVAASADQPQGTVAMSEGDPMRTRLGSHVEGAGVIGHDVADAEEGASQDTPPGARPGYEAERPVGDAPVATAPVAATAPTAFERDPALAAEPVVDQGDLGAERDPGLTAEPVVDQGSYGQDPGYVGDEPVIDRSTGERTAGGVAAAGERVEDAGPSDRSAFADEPPAPERSAFATEDAGSADRTTVAEEPARFGAGDVMADPGPTAAGYEGEPGGAGVAGYQEETERLARPGPRDPDGQDGVFDQEADQARPQRPSDG
jgi:hypothetical protein